MSVSIRVLAVVWLLVISVLFFLPGKSLPAGGMFRVVTDLAVFEFDKETRRLTALALNPGVTREQVQDNTGFKVEFSPDASVSEPPTAHELSTLRMLDPERLFIA